jgi:hypothetical protein
VLEHTVQQGESNLRVTFAGANVGTRWRDSLDNTFPQAGILNGQALWAGVGWLVNAILIHGAMDVLLGPVADELARHQAQKAAAIATWAIIGPLADDETGLTRTLGPETDGNLSRTFIGRRGSEPYRAMGTLLQGGERGGERDGGRLPMVWLGD